MMAENDRARELINDRGLSGAIRLAQLQRRGATDGTRRAYWDRVLDALKAESPGNAATAAYQIEIDGE